MTTPKVKIEELDTENHAFSVTIGDERYSWRFGTLIEAAKDIEPFDIPLAAIDTSVMVWGAGDKSIKDFIFEFNRVKKADLKYPIILTDYGFICDGWHRVVKAILKGDKTIKGIRLYDMPEADKITKIED